MIDAVIYGVMLSANIVKLLKAPPENRSNRSNSPASLVNICDKDVTVDVRDRYVGPDTEDDEHQQGK